MEFGITIISDLIARICRDETTTFKARIEFLFATLKDLKRHTPAELREIAARLRSRRAEGLCSSSGPGHDPERERLLR